MVMGAIEEIFFLLEFCSVTAANGMVVSVGDWPNQLISGSWKATADREI